MFCSNCGKEIPDEAVVCVHCGTQVKRIQVQTKDEAPASIGMKIVSFLIPLVGLIIYCVNISSAPNKAKECGIAAIIGFFVGAIMFASMGYF